MTLPTGNPPNTLHTVGSTGGGVSKHRDVAALDYRILRTQVEWMDFCPKCLAEMHFIAAWRCDAGLLGYCLGCGDERIAPFTRVNSEVA